VSTTPESLAEDLRRRLFPDRPPGDFDPVRRWDDLGLLVTALEAQGLFLMTNSAADPMVKRMASFHRSTPRGFPCAGSSEWGRFPTHGEAILRAAHEAILAPRA
jgi:hypothetical protein